MRHVTDLRFTRVRARMTWLGLGLAILAWPAGAWAATFNYTNSTAITIPATGTGDTSGSPATPYASNIFVAGFIGTPNHVTVTLTGLTHTFPDDIDILLVGPRVSPANKMILMSDAGSSHAINAVTLVFDLAAGATLPDDGLITSGTFLPSNFGADADLFPAPAPLGPFDGTLTDVEGRDPNGTWALYIVDDAGLDTGSLSGGWTLTLITADVTDTPDDGPPPNSVPEPATAHLLLSGLALLGGLSWRHARRKYLGRAGPPGR